MVHKEFDQNRYQALKTENALQSTLRTIWQLQSEKLRAGLKLILDLPFLMINHLPDRVYKAVLLTAILALVLSACAATAVPGSDQHNPVAGETAALSNAATVKPAETATPAPTETQVISQVEQLFTAYLAGEQIDAGNLSSSELAELSKKITDKLNQERGINPVIFNNEAYIHPDHYMMMDYDGHPDKSETIEMFIPVAGKDSQGNLQVKYQGKTITVQNSADIDWNMQITDAHDSRIDWPKTEGWPVETELQWQIATGPNHLILMPAILLDKNISQFFLEKRGMNDSLHLLTAAETDMNNQALAFRLSLAISLNIVMQEEGSELEASGFSSSIKNREIYEHLQENAVYYLGIYSNQQEVWQRFMFGSSLNGYTGLVEEEEMFSVLTKQTKNDREVMLLPVKFLVKKK